MKAINNALLAVLVALVASGLVASGDMCTRAETGGPPAEVGTENFNEISVTGTAAPVEKRDLVITRLFDKKIVSMKLIEFSQGLSDKDGNRIDPTTMGMPAEFPKEIPSALVFKSVGNMTELTATEYGWTVGQMSDMSEAGLNQCLDKLAAVLARR